MNHFELLGHRQSPRHRQSVAITNPAADYNVASVTDSQSEMPSSIIYGFNLDLFMDEMSGSPVLDIDF